MSALGNFKALSAALCWIGTQEDLNYTFRYLAALRGLVSRVSILNIKRLLVYKFLEVGSFEGIS